MFDMTSSESKSSLANESDSESNENETFIQRTSYHPILYRTTLWIVHLILLLTSTALFVASFLQYREVSTPVYSIEPD
jgi:hypothetical protein